MREIVHEEKLRDKLWNRAVSRGVEPGARDRFKARCLYNTGLSPDTRKLFQNKSAHMFRKTCERNGGGRWIRTIEVVDNRFTVCPI